MVAKRTAATFDPDILLAVGCDLSLNPWPPSLAAFLPQSFKVWIQSWPFKLMR